MPSLRNAEIQPNCGNSFNWSIRAWVNMPRSPTNTMRSNPNRPRSSSTWSGTVVGSPVLPE